MSFFERRGTKNNGTMWKVVTQGIHMFNMKTSPTSSGLKVIAKVKVFVHTANANARAMTQAPQTFIPARLKLSYWPRTGSDAKFNHGSDGTAKNGHISISHQAVTTSLLSVLFKVKGEGHSISYVNLHHQSCSDNFFPWILLKPLQDMFRMKCVTNRQTSF